MTGPLEGVKVLDLTEGVAGPFATKQLADLGADVVKIERPGGDPARQIGPFPGDAPHLEKSGIFAHLNTNKRSVVLNPAESDGRDTILGLAQSADALVENFPPGKMAAWDLGYDALSAINPRMVMTSLSPFGQTGPAANRKATNLTISARSSFLLHAGEPDREPLKYAGRQTDFVGGLHAAWGTMVGLFHAAMTGEGQWVDVSQLEAAVMLADHFLVGAAYYAAGARTRAGRYPLRFPRSIMPVADGYVSMLITDLQWPRFCRMVGLEKYARDPDLASPKGRADRLEEMEVAFVPWFLARTKQEVFDIAQAQSVPIAPFNTIPELLSDPQLISRDYFRKIVHPELGELTLTGPPAILSGTPWEIRRPAPLLDQHAREIIQEEPAPLAAPVMSPPLPGIGGIALRGVRVLDFTSAWAGPRLTQYLAQMGAEVIHVESIQYLDNMRGWSKWAVGVTGAAPNNNPGRKPWERNSQYHEFGKNKLGITLNLADSRGVELFKAFAKISDVVVDNYKAGMMHRFGLDYAALKQLQPDIIQVSIPGFGTTGPYREYVAWGNQVTALTGHGLLLNYEGEDEPEPGGTYGDPIAAITGAFAVVAALHHRRRTGDGQYIEVALSEVLPPLLPEAIAEYTLNGRLPLPLGNHDPSAVPSSVYPTVGEDAWIAIACAGDAEAKTLFELIGRPDLAEKYPGLSDRRKARREIDVAIAAWTITQNHRELADRLQAAGIATEAAARLVDVLSDPQLLARGFFTRLDHPEAGEYPYPLQAVRLSKTPPIDHRPAPTYGQHNREILGGLLELTDSDLAALTTAEVIGDQPLEDDVRLSRARSGGITG